MKPTVREPWTAFVESPAGTGNWYAFNVPWTQVLRAAKQWRDATQGHSKLWLCWNVHDGWCLLQQKLVREVGWTPVVGWDPTRGVGKPPLVSGAIAIDFNAGLGIPSLFMHVPLELAFLWIEDKLGFWHSDLLLTRSQMRELADCFARLPGDRMAAVFSYGGIRNLLKTHLHRYWELCGCTTQQVSNDQFECGSGWWKNIAFHPNAPKGPAEQARRKALPREHGVGIRYWEKHYGGRILKLNERTFAATHFSAISVPSYKRASSKAEEMNINFDLGAIARDLNIHDLLRSS